MNKVKVSELRKLNTWMRQYPDARVTLRIESPDPKLIPFPYFQHMTDGEVGNKRRGATYYVQADSLPDLTPEEQLARDELKRAINKSDNGGGLCE